MVDNGQNAVRVCAQADVPPGSVKAFTVGPDTLAVYNIDGTYYITEDECTHAAASLADGMLEGDVKGERPGMFDMMGRGKYDSWAKLKGMSKDDAMKKYADKVGALLKTHK